MKANKYLLFNLSIALFLFLIVQIISNIAAKCLILTVNNNLIFGLFGSNQIGVWLSSFLILFLFIKLLQSKQINLPLLAIIVGAVSNLVDRVHYGGVLDYINLPLIPTFNTADMLIVLGIIFLTFSYLKTPSQDAKS